MCWASEYEVHRADDWRVVVNWNQDRLGKVMLASLRHVEDVTELSDGEVLGLWALVRESTQVLRDLFGPEHFDYSFLMNLDAHAHLHLIPRYEGPRTFAGREFVDEGERERRLAPEEARELVTALREAFASG
jgi:diadenosine tetraphosphate (Ap4A) HIT family hydrolase